MRPIAETLASEFFNTIIDRYPISVTEDTLVLDVIKLMNQEGKTINDVLVVKEWQVIGLFSEQDVVRLVSTGVDFAHAKISEVMKTSVFTLTESQIEDFIFPQSLFLLFKKYDLRILPVLDRQSKLIGNITLEKIYQALLAKDDGETYRQKYKLLSLLESVVTNSKDAVLLTKANSLDTPFNSCIIYVNQAFTEMSGWSAWEILGKTPSILQSELTDNSGWELIHTALQSGLRVTTEFINYHKNGAKYWVEVDIFPIADEKGEITHFVNIQRDITSHKLIEDNLWSSVQLFQQLVENIHQVLFVRDIKQNKIIYINPAYEKIFGRKRDLLYENPEELIDAVHPEDRERLNAKITTSLDGNYNEEYRIIRPDGEVRWVWTRGFPLKNNLGEVYRLTGISEDITERKQAQNILQETNADLERRVSERTKILKQTNHQLMDEIQERLKIEEKLRKSQQMLRLVMDNIPQGVFWKDRDSIYLGCNRNFAYNAGFDNPQLIVGKTDYDLSWSKEYSESSRQWDAKVMATNQAQYHIIETQQQFDGNKVWVETNKVPLHDAQGNVVGILGTVEDITERKQSEETLLGFRTAIECASDAICMTDSQGNVIHLNRAFRELFEYSTEELNTLGSLAAIYVSHADYRKVFAKIHRGKSWRGAVTMRSKSGRILDIELRTDAIKNFTGESIGTVNINTDITQRLRTEKELRLRERAIAASNNGVLISDATIPNNPIMYVNSAFENITGYSISEAIGQSRDFYINNDLEANKLLSEEQLNKFFSTIIRNYRKDNSECWNELSISPVYSQNGILTNFIVVQTDITDYKKLEQQLREALEKEKELNELKSRFVSTTSHEFRTPLTTILSSSELLENYGHKWNKENRFKYLKKIQLAVKRMTNLLEDVLNLEKAEAGKLQCKPKYFELVKYSLSLIEDLQINQPQTKIIFDCDHQSLEVYMDKKLLRHILSNLLSNAIKYSPDIKPIYFTIVIQNHHAVFTIKDQGIGIPQDHLPHLFESFNRANNVDNIQGTGLGLSIVKKCIDICQGEINVISKVGNGTIFTVKLPLNMATNS
ncbi:PAS domain S-box protein [Mastigocoleus sp. MO_188.B34]|uniref:PAS domain S-box protein n=1 Tax=Mastigocoleus sp. MO_188.B34 TaxID=3036635 RepID=UPI00262778AA|nr:PAS domain S-box protein [Mastigocoleus sp. MO_188.B34]MDJ0696683.1 PAS domain S-box protein [Mastigocoleus sp. MO_188.B34]